MARRTVLLALLLVLAVATWLRFGALLTTYGHPDENIPANVVVHMLGEPTLDTNWKNADVHPDFRYPQYNFSGYMVFAAVAVLLSQVLPVLGDETTLGMLRAWSALLGVVAVAQTFFLGRTLFGAAAGLLGAAFAAIALLLCQDSLYARPETFVTVLTLAYVQVLLSPRLGPRARIVRASLLLGFLVGTKVSMLMLAPGLLLAGRQSLPAAGSWKAWLRAEWERRRPVLRAALAWAPPCVALGFILAAPYALVNPRDYLHGLQTLATQYGGGHWPHGVPDGSAAQRLLFAGRYFTATLGLPLLLAMAIGAAGALRRRDGDALLVFALFALTVLRFGSYPTFFERNVSHVLPLGLAFAGAGVLACAQWVRQPRARAALLAGLLALTALPAWQATSILRFDLLPGQADARLVAARKQVEAEYGLHARYAALTIAKQELLTDVAPCEANLLEVNDPGDRQTAAAIRDLEGRGFRVVHVAPTPFAHVPTSTLNTYFPVARLFLFREFDARDCGEPVARLSALRLGAALPVLKVQADASWTPGGAFFRAPRAPAAVSVLGSWSGDFARTGVLRMVVDTGGASALVLPYITGTSTAGQSLVLRDAASGTVLLSLDPLPKRVGWNYLRVPLPPGTRQVLLEASDQGRDQGEWLAVGAPHREIPGV